MIVGNKQWPEKIKLEEEAKSEILVVDTDSGNQVRRLAMWKTILRRKKKRNNNSSSSKPQQKSPQQTLASKITNPPALPPVFFSRPKKGHTVRQMWRGPVRSALFRRISHKSKFLINHPLCEYCVSRYNSDPRCHRPYAAARIMYWTTYTIFYIMYVIHRPKFIIKIGEYFFPDKPIH